VSQIALPKFAEFPEASERMRERMMLKRIMSMANAIVMTRNASPLVSVIKTVPTREYAAAPQIPKTSATKESAAPYSYGFSICE
jgi:hypothetical protein